MTTLILKKGEKFTFNGVPYVAEEDIEIKVSETSPIPDSSSPNISEQ